jgi:hypothetical protein
MGDESKEPQLEFLEGRPETDEQKMAIERLRYLRGIGVDARQATAGLPAREYRALRAAR